MIRQKIFHFNSWEKLMFHLVEPVHNNNFSIILFVHISQNIVSNNLVFFLTLILSNLRQYFLFLSDKVIFIGKVILFKKMEQMIICRNWRGLLFQINEFIVDYYCLRINLLKLFGFRAWSGWILRLDLFW